MSTVCLHSEAPLCFKNTHESCCLSTLVYYMSVISACNMSIARDCCAFKIQLCRGALLSEVLYPFPIYGNPNSLYSPSPAWILSTSLKTIEYTCVHVLIFYSSLYILSRIVNGWQWALVCFIHNVFSKQRTLSGTQYELSEDFWMSEYWLKLCPVK